MTSFIRTLGQSISSYLPQNEHAQNVNEIEAHVSELQSSLTDRTGDVFQNRLLVTTTELQVEKHECLNALRELNGSFYQDPESSLKKGWDKLVEKVLTAIGFRVETRNDLNTATVQLDSVAVTQETLEAKTAIQTYVRRETKRNNTQETLNDILSTEMTPVLQDSLVDQKQNLEARQKALCGAYYQDPNGLLDQAWKAFKTAESTASVDTATLSQTFLGLEEERKSNEAKLFDLQKQLCVQPNPARSYEALTESAITAEITSLNELRNVEAPQAGVNWRRTAVGVGAIVGSVGAYATGAVGTLADTLADTAIRALVSGVTSI